MNARFALYNYAGNPVSHYFVEQRTVDGEAGTTSENVSHHIIVVDRSGSMYRDIDPMKAMLEKLLTLEEYQNAGMLISVVSYSSRGDLTSHFERVPVADVMQEGSPYLQALRQIRSTGLTCISQALEYARGLVQNGETTCISLHSDGFANHYSPTSERRDIEALTQSFSQLNNVFVNTIAYSARSDFQLLSGVANALSGVCIRASNIRQVYDALHDTTALLAGQVSSAISSPLDGATYQIFVSNSARKVNGGAEDLTIRGLSANDDKVIYRFREVTAAEYDASTLPVCGEGATLSPVLAFARVNLSEGNLNTAKYAMVSTRDKTLLDEHAKALTNAEIADLTEALDTYLFGGIPATHIRTTNFGIDTSTISVLDLVSILREHTSEFTVNLTELKAHYNARGVSRVAGTRDDEGNLVTPRLKTAYTDDETAVRVNGFDINRNTATINMRVARPVNLIEEDGTVIDEVAGIPLDLSTFNNYTIVGDGSLNLTHLNVQINSKKLFRALTKAGVLAGDFDPTKTYRVSFAGRPLVNFSQSFDPSVLDGLFDKLATAKVLSSMVSALLKESSDMYTPDQIAALKDHYLSPNLNINFPTTNPYTDLQEALNSGSIDTRVSYKVDIGSCDILNLSKLHSANKCLERFFTAETRDENGKITAVKKPPMTLFWDETANFNYKKLSARTKITPVDDLMKPIFEDFLGLGEGDALTAALKFIGAADLMDDVQAVVERTVDQDTAIETLTELGARADRLMNRIFREDISPLVFYIGSAGLVPDEFGVKAQTADDISEAYPDLKLSKAEKEGTFFDLPNGTIITVFTKSEYFSTGAAK